MSADEAQKIFDKNLYPWAQEGDEADSTLLHEATVEEEAVLVAKGFADVPKLVEFAWTSHPEYLEFDEVRSVLRKRTSVSMPESAFEEEEAEEDTDAFEDVGGGDDPVVATSSTDDEFDEEAGGELEAEAPSAEAEAPSAEDDTEFDEFAQSFVTGGSFEEDEDDSAEFDPEAEADEISESMGESLSKASKALAKSAKRSSPKRKLKPRSK